MASKPRSHVFDPDEVGIYHCWNRIVQRRHLFGFDRLTGRDYSYRKDWVLDRLIALAGSMAIDVLDYAILGNHLHVVLRNRPDIAAAWSDQEVARRWWYVCPLRKNKDGSIPEPLPSEIKLYQQKAGEYRSRLSDISWMMRLLCQPIARRANGEDEVDGRFFAKRFDCERLETLAQVLACSLYVDLNVIRAGIAETPEDSKFTSAHDRIRARWQQTQRELERRAAPADYDADAWLAPIFLDERAEAYPPRPSPGSASVVDQQGTKLYNAVGAPRISDKGFLPTTRDQYLTLLDGLGRIVQKGKRGFIPPELPPILERLQVDAQRWLDSVWDLFDRDWKTRVPTGLAGAG